MEEQKEVSSRLPLMAWRYFAEQVGLTHDSVRGMCNRGQLPVVKVGKRRFIDLRRLDEYMRPVDA
jgi:hypothetical protein